MVAFINAVKKRILSIGILVSLIFLNACKDSDKNDSLIFEELNESLENSNRIAENSVILQLNALKEKLRDQAFAIKAKYWYDKADTIHLLSKQIIVFLDSLQSKNKKTIDEKLDKKLEVLFEKLKNYKIAVIKLDTVFSREFGRKGNIISTKFLGQFETGKEFAEKSFKQFTNENALTKLLEFENDIRVAENDLITFGSIQFGGCDLAFTRIRAIVYQNKSHLVPGEDLIINAGIGSYSTACMPSYKFAENNVNMNENGLGIYKIKVENKPGKYIIPVEIGYTDLNGQRQTIFDRIEYTVE